MRKIQTLLAAGLVVGAMGGGVANAAERDHGWSRWKAGDVVQSNEAAKYGPSCKTEFASRGTGPVGFGITQFWAKRHTTRNWQDAAVKLYGAGYGKWSRARNKSVTCDREGDLWNCKATGTPCT